ncbi:MAG: hypothetical protein ABT02_14315 [Comamonadaceae bacterium SCN 68-20]|jgi:uncharacterized protein (DUF1697 family)|nr:DUF1697 domain-containing protein [Comamonadaceae bacterium]ODU58493.1 MAG: hypothetical protein ABT02_14315 [Comamonadaceae bacterium SCN 68-20]OJX33122.1 MAG: hypothetical protein BGO75_16815 [Burkholderiales bacterium 68-20]
MAPHTATDTAIALLRGVNVGGRGILPMHALAALLEALGARQVRTYIQSGNAVFEPPANLAAGQLAQALSDAIERYHGFAPQVLVLDRAALAQAIASNPFADAAAQAPDHVHLGFLHPAPPAPDLARLHALRRDGEQFHLAGGVFYLHAPEGIGRSRLAAQAERLLGSPMTLRNWKTVCQLHAMAQGQRERPSSPAIRR